VADDLIISQGLRLILETQEGFEMVGESRRSEPKRSAYVLTLYHLTWCLMGSAHARHGWAERDRRDCGPNSPALPW